MRHNPMALGSAQTATTAVDKTTSNDKPEGLLYGHHWAIRNTTSLAIRGLKDLGSGVVMILPQVHLRVIEGERERELVSVQG